MKNEENKILTNDKSQKEEIDTLERQINERIKNGTIKAYTYEDYLKSLDNLEKEINEKIKSGEIKAFTYENYLKYQEKIKNNEEFKVCEEEETYSLTPSNPIPYPHDKLIKTVLSNN